MRSSKVLAAAIAVGIIATAMLSFFPWLAKSDISGIMLLVFPFIVLVAFADIGIAFLG